MVAVAMKILAVVAVAGIVVSAQPTSDITEEQVDKFCQPQSGVSEAEIKKAKSGDWSSKETASRKYNLCYFKKIGVIDDSNNFQKDAFFLRLPKNLTPEKVEADVENCVEQHHDETPEEFAWNWAACYFAKYPFALVF